MRPKLEGWIKSQKRLATLTLLLPTDLSTRTNQSIKKLKHTISFISSVIGRTLLLQYLVWVQVLEGAMQNDWSPRHLHSLLLSNEMDNPEVLKSKLLYQRNIIYQWIVLHELAMKGLWMNSDYRWSHYPERRICFLVWLCFKSYKLVLSPSVWLLAPGYRLRSSDQQLLKVEAAGDLLQVRLETRRTVLCHCCRWYLLTSRGQPVPTDVEEKRRVMENVLKRRSEFRSECWRCRKTGRECHPESVWAL